MAKNPKKQIITKKHLARAERERRQTRFILLGSALVIIAILGLIGYGILDNLVLKALQPVAVVNGDKVTTRQFQDSVRFTRTNLIQNAASMYNMIQQFGADSEYTSYFAQQLQQAQYQMEGSVVGPQVMDDLVGDALVRQEAERRGITVTKAEVDKKLEEVFGFYENGTPTPTATFVPVPTSTLSPLQMTLVPPTPTPTATAIVTVTETLTATQAITPTAEVQATYTATIAPTEAATATPTGPITPTATAAPTATATPYTREGYQSLYEEQLKTYEDYGVSEETIRYVVELGLYREKVMDAVLSEIGVSRMQDQVWARHILVPTEESAKDVKSQLEAGADFRTLAALYSTDEGTKNNGGDLGWFSYETMIKPFSDAAFKLKVGEISDPVQSDEGWHIIQVLGHEEKALTGAELEQLRQTKFQEWLDKLREDSEVDIKDNYLDRVPAGPDLPLAVQQFIEQYTQQQQQQFNIPTAAP